MDSKIRQYLSDDFNNLQEPDFKLMKDARAVIAGRKKQNLGIVPSFLNFFKLEISVYQSGFAVLIVAACIIFVSQQKYTGGGLYDFRTQTATTSINSSMVLSGLTQYTNANHSVNSSTVLTSIITFVAKN